MFSKKVNLAILNLLLKDEDFSDSIELISDKLFDEDEFALDSFKKMKALRSKYGELNKSIFKEEYPKTAKNILSFKYKKIENYARQNLKKFIFISNVKKNVTIIAKEFSNNFKKISEDKIKDCINKILNSVVEEKGTGELFYFNNPANRIIKIDSRVGVSTGWFGIDNKLFGGGLCPGELGIILAPPNAGKSASLVNLAVSAANFGRQVLYVTLEMDKEFVAHRLDMRIAGLTTEEVRGNISQVSKRLKEFQQISRGNILIKGFQSEAATVRDIEKYIEQKRRKDVFNTNFLIVDYADILSSRRKRNREDLEVKEIYEDLRKLGNKKNYAMPIWTASQSHRLKDEVKVLEMKHFTDAFAKGFVGDVVISLNQTKEDEEKGEMFLYIAKNRNKGARDGERIKVDWTRMLMTDVSDYEIYYSNRK